MIPVLAAAAKNIRTVMGADFIEIRDFKDFLLLLPEEGSPSFDILPSGRLITAGRDILYAGTDGNEAEACKKAFLIKLDKEQQAWQLTEEKGEGRWILPPFANTHCHIAMSLFRGSPADYDLHDWLFSWIFPREEKLTHSIVKAGSDLAIAEMIRCGCGASADMYYFADAVAQAAEEAGFRLNLSFDGKSKDQKGLFVQNHEEALAFAERFRNHPMVRPSLHVHSLYLYQKELYYELGELLTELNIPVQIHLAETLKEIEDLKRSFGQTPAEILRDTGLLRDGSVLAHCVWLGDEDIAVLKNKDVYLAHNPSSNCKLGSGIADTDRYFAEGLKVTLGTDGAGSNDTLDMFREMRLAAFLPKVSKRQAAAAPPERWLYAATRQGYRALGFGECGSLRAGTPADFMIYNPHRLGSAPAGQYTDPFSLLVYAGSSCSVDALMINGQYLLKNGELQNLDEEKIIFEAERAAAKLQ